MLKLITLQIAYQGLNGLSKYVVNSLYSTKYWDLRILYRQQKSRAPSSPMVFIVMIGT